jgi:hypothetical protein
LARIKGFILTIVGLFVIASQSYYLIIEPIIYGRDLQLSNQQYWAIVIPVFGLTFIFAFLMSWIGYTMITTPEPIRLDYEEAYEHAREEESGAD